MCDCSAKGRVAQSPKHHEAGIRHQAELPEESHGDVQPATSPHMFGPSRPMAPQTSKDTTDRPIAPYMFSAQPELVKWLLYRATPELTIL